jgi:hypothetical protein
MHYTKRIMSLVAEQPKKLYKLLEASGKQYLSEEKGQLGGYKRRYASLSPSPPLPLSPSPLSHSQPLFTVKENFMGGWIVGLPYEL